MLELLDVDDLRALLFKAELNTLNEKDSIVNVRLPFAIRLTQKDVAPKGVCRLFDTLPHFEARLHYDEQSDCAGEADLRKWHASFDVITSSTCHRVQLLTCFRTLPSVTSLSSRTLIIPFSYRFLADL